MVTSATTANKGKYGDLSRRLIFLLLALVVYRVGAHIPVPGIDPAQLQQLFNGQQGGILSLFNMFSGGALSRFTVFALGIMPYISASIIMQLLTYVLPAFEQLKKEGEAGRRKITQYTRYGTVLLALVQGYGIAVGLESMQGKGGISAYNHKRNCVWSGRARRTWNPYSISSIPLGCRANSSEPKTSGPRNCTRINPSVEARNSYDIGYV
ncbi:MAG: Protein translocase subunit SecY [Pseudomonadota bacterium]